MLKRVAHWLGPLAATILPVVLVVIASVIVTNNINSSEEQASFQRLAEEAGQFANSLEVNMASDRRQLELIAEMAGSYMASGVDELIKFIDDYHGTGTFFSRLELLLPGDIVFSPPGMQIDATGKLSFEEEAALARTSPTARSTSTARTTSCATLCRCSKTARRWPCSTAS